MRKNKHLLLWSSLGVLICLGAAIVQENVLREWRRIQQSARAEGKPVNVHLRQVVVPALDVADRCVSCHLGMAAGETGITGPPVTRAHPRLPHDPAGFGCTVCHGGQGRATEEADAHGNVRFWPEPMLPREFLYAGCGSCHTHLMVPSVSELEEGRRLFERNDCLACHRVDGRGATIRPGGAGGMEGPDLSAAGARGYDAGWYDKHLARVSTDSAGAFRKSFGPLGPGDRAALDIYLASRVGAPGLVEAKALFHSLGCRGCHKVGGVGGDDGPDLTREGQRDPGRLDFTHVPGEPILAGWLAAHFRDPARIVPGSAMPILGLSDEQVKQLTFYMLSLRRTDVPEAFWPKDRIQSERFGRREFAVDGRTLYGTFCTACHGPSGEGMRYAGMPAFPNIANPDFLAIASDDFLRNTVRHGRPGRRMPAWGDKEGGLRPAEIDSVVAWVRHIGGTACEPDPKSRLWARDPSGDGRRLFGAYCASCHGAEGQGAEGPALNNRVLLASAGDTYLYETIRRGRRGSSMSGFEVPSSVRAALTPAEMEAIVAFLRSWEEKQP